MRRSQRTWFYRFVVVAATLPLLASSCVEIAERSLINGFFDATTPLVGDQLADYLSEALGGVATP
jgi:hypothetical protein